MSQELINGSGGHHTSPAPKAEVVSKMVNSDCVKGALSEFRLSPRELEVSLVVLEGLSNEEVASRLGCTEKTVKYHLTSIFRKTKIPSRSKFIVWCWSKASEIPVLGKGV